VAAALAMFDGGFGESAFGEDRGTGFGGGASGFPRSSVGASVAEDLFRPLAGDERQRLARVFEQGRGPDGFVPADEGRRQLEQTGVSTEMLQRIWNLSDLDRDGRLSLREFVCAMHLAEQVRQGQSLPVEVKAEQQVALVQGVEALVSNAASGFAPHSEALKPRHDDFSTVDTTTSAARHRGLGDLDVSDQDISISGRSHFDIGGTSLRVGGGQAPILEEPTLGAARNARLGQLAAVFEVVARLDPEGELRRICQEVFEERSQLEQQLAKRRDYERHLKQVRGELDNLRDSRRKVETDKVATQRRISHLQDELAFVESEVRSAEEDLQLLREAHGPGMQDHRRGPAPYSSPEEERRDMISKMRSERELLQKDQRSIEEIRSKLNGIFKEKFDAQAMQQSLLEKQRQTEQDRGLMLTAIEAERSKLSAMCAERLRLWEERSTLEREMTELDQEQFLAGHQMGGRNVSRGGNVPVAGNFHTAPPAGAQRARGVRQEEEPGVVYGTLPGMESDNAGASGTNPFGRGAADPFGSGPRVDYRGVRN